MSASAASRGMLVVSAEINGQIVVPTTMSMAGAIRA